jgi:transglycosylase-like protein with SLT domain
MDHPAAQSATEQAPTQKSVTPDRPQPRGGATPRALHRAAAVVAMCLAFAFAGQSVAQAASSAQAYQAYATQQLGGPSSQSSCLIKLWQRESGWNPRAQNATSTAYGIPQFINATWATTGIAKTSDPYRQVDAGLIYIENRYGSPCTAWAFWKRNGWY